MKKITFVLVLIALIGLKINGLSQSIILSTDSRKTCKVEITVGQIKNNLIELTINPNWIAENFTQIIDNQSLLVLEREKIEVNNPNYIRLISPASGNLIASNAAFKLVYEVSEKYKGGDFVFKFPFLYSSSIEAIKNEKNLEEFTFKRPRDFSLTIGIKQADVVNKYPPKITIVSPEGVDEGLKPILDTTILKVTLFATDASGIESVMLNNVAATMVNDTTYSVNLPLKVGYENTIVATVTDNGGRVSRKQFPVECRQKIKPIAIVPSTPATPKIEPSDIDVDIPVVTSPDPNRFALIIGNEDYSSSQTNLQTESNVEFAVHDAEIFKEYAIKVFGIPEENIIFRKDAKVMDMQRAINQVNSIAKNSKGKAEIYVFYAGHGFPDEQSKEPYLIPVDVSGSDLQFAIKLNDFYKKLTEFPTKRVTVFLDACFSGGGRNLGLIAARGVKVKPKDILLKGNIVVFTASSGEQSSLPYHDKVHGMFTYYLLKKIKETKGEINLFDLSEYLSTEIGIRSVIVNKDRKSVV